MRPSTASECVGIILLASTCILTPSERRASHSSLRWEAGSSTTTSRPRSARQGKAFGDLVANATHSVMKLRTLDPCEFLSLGGEDSARKAAKSSCRSAFSSNLLESPSGHRSAFTAFLGKTARQIGKVFLLKSLFSLQRWLALWSLSGRKDNTSSEGDSHGRGDADLPSTTRLKGGLGFIGLLADNHGAADQWVSCSPGVLSKACAKVLLLSASSWCRSITRRQSPVTSRPAPAKSIGNFP